MGLASIPVSPLALAPRLHRTEMGLSTFSYVDVLYRHGLVATRSYLLQRLQASLKGDHHP